MADKSKEVSAKADAVEKRLGGSMTGTTKRAKPTTSIHPTGNPLKGKIGMVYRRKF